MAFVLFVIGLHTTFVMALPSGKYFPYILCLLAVLFSLPAVFRTRFTREEGKKGLQLFVFYILVAVITWFSTADIYWLRGVRGLAQLAYSLGLAMGLYHLVSNIDRVRLSRLCLTILAFMAVAGALEALGPLRSLSDAFRSWSNPSWFYDSDYRDLSEMGAIRAKIFCPEPSMVGITAYWLTMIIVWGGAMRVFGMVVLFISLLLLTWSVRSPFLGITVVMAFISAFMLKLFDRGALRTKLMGWPKILGACALAILAGMALWPLFSERYQSLIEGDGSFNMRFRGPFIFSTNFVMNNPLVGVGMIGDLEILVSDIRTLYMDLGMQWIAEVDDTFLAKGLSNAVALHFVYFGGVSGFGLLALLVVITRLRNLGYWIVLLLQLGVFWQLQGGYNSAPIWCISAALLAAAQMREPRPVVPGSRISEKTLPT